MTRLPALMALSLSAATSMAWAESPAPAPTSRPAASTTEKSTKTEYQTGDWLHWQKMTGDWGGVRSTLADMGITFDINVTQIAQGNAHGGVSTRNGFRYSGSADLTLTLDTKKLGLWEGGTVILNAEPKWGKGINGKVGSLIPVNMDALKPTGDDDCVMTLSEYFLQQALFDGKIVLLAGKLDGARAFDTNVFANDERTQFMNVGLRNNPIIPGFIPYTTLGVGVVLNPVDWLSIRTAVTDSEGRATTTGFNTAFHGPTHTSIAHEWDFAIKPFGLPGNQRIGFLWTSMEKQYLQPRSPFKESAPYLVKAFGPKFVNMLAPYLPFDTSKDASGIYYNFDQYLYTEKDDPTQGIGLFGRFGWAKQDICAASHFYSIGAGGKGVIPDRDKDTMGVGYFFTDLSNELPSTMHSEQGIECYYNIEIAPWMHVSPDLQILVNPDGTDAYDVSVVYGVRMQVSL